MSLLIIQHAENCPPGRLVEYAPTAHVVRMWETPTALRPYLNGDTPLPSGMVVLGGPQHAYADDEWPWLPDVRTLLQRAHEASVPTLAICLGMQLVAVAGGGEVALAAPAGPEVGVIPLYWKDAMPAGFPTASLVYADHGDAVATPPQGALILAESDRYPHVIQWGSVVGVQYHPEVTPQIVATWKETYPPHKADQIEAEYLEYEDDCAKHCMDLCAHVFGR